MTERYTFGLDNPRFPITWKWDTAVCDGTVRLPRDGVRVVPIDASVSGISIAAEAVLQETTVAMEVIRWDTAASDWEVIGVVEVTGTSPSQPWSLNHNGQTYAAGLSILEVSSGDLLALRESSSAPYTGSEARHVSVSLWLTKIESNLAPFYWESNLVGLDADPDVLLNQLRVISYETDLAAVSWGAENTGTGDISVLELVHMKPGDLDWIQLAELEFVGGNEKYSQVLNAEDLEVLLPSRTFPAGTVFGIRDISTSTVVVGASVIVLFGNIVVPPAPPPVYPSWQNELRLAFNKEGILPR